jgi:uracil-DNA glycosylase family 4
MDADVRKHPAAKCEECPWQRHPYAGAKGPDDADMVVVGEAPGAQEVQQGIPFVGPSGKLLDKVLEHHRFDSNQIRFTNAVACHPPFVRGQAPEPPPKEAVRCCSPRLGQELLGRGTILLLGNVAKEAVLGTREPITKVRQGPPRTDDRFPGAKIVASIHPAACLRHGDSFPSLVKDVGKLSTRGGQAYAKWEPPKYAAFDERESAVAALRALDNKRGPIAVDIEVGVDKDSSFTHPDDLLCVGIGYAPNRAFVIGENALKHAEVQAALATVLADKDVTEHNGKYDDQVLMRLGIIDEPAANFDTMLASYVQDERPGFHGLEGRACEVLGAPTWKHELDRFKSKNDSYAVVPRKVLYRYNAWDVSQTYLLREHDEKKLRQQGLTHVHDHLLEVAQELIYLELDGLGIDVEYLDELLVEYLDVLEPLEAELRDLISWPTFNPRSPQQVLKVLHGFKMPANNTEADTLKRLHDTAPVGTKRRRWLEVLLEHRKHQKSYSTYVKGTKKRLLDGRVYPTYSLHGSTSGRIACRNPNVQNITRGYKLRRMYVPHRGWTFIQGDYKQAELRVMTVEGRDEYLRGVFNDPERDLLGEVTERFYGPGWTKEQRVRGKAVVYGVSYGREAPSIAGEYGIAVGEAQGFIDAWFELAKGVASWRKDIINQVFKEGQALQTHFGRKRRFWLITRENRVDVEKEALSFVPQSTANDICLSALVRMRRLFGTGSDAPRIRIPVHDSLLVESREPDRDEVGHLQQQVMEETAAEVYSDYVKFPVDITYGANWGEISDE